MAQGATIYNLSIELAHVDRAVYEAFELRIARQSSESSAYMLMRILAYCLEYEDGIALTEGVAAGDEPAIYIRDLTGHPLAWIDVGLPSAEHVHRGSKAADRSAIYTSLNMKVGASRSMGFVILKMTRSPKWIGTSQNWPNGRC